MPWITLAMGDYAVKLAIAVAMLGPWWLALRARADRAAT
jgi:uncharacterized PurR-regulated membrane protein YhhQ (DUF165 family)